jgi:choline dehydrogenase-like flavoprotein
MRLNAPNVHPREVIETDVCIVGAGVAGLVVAAQLAETTLDVVVLESGAASSDAAAQTLNDGDIRGDDYLGLCAARHRQVGGSAYLWNTPTAPGVGAKYVPLDPWDFEPRWPEAPHGWPLSHEQLRRFYARAQEIAGLGRFDYEAAAFWSHDVAPVDLGRELVSRVYQIASRDALLLPLLGRVGRASNVRLLTRATVVLLAAQGAAATATVAHSDGGLQRVRARRVVLAAGAIENARILLVSAAADAGVRDRSAWLGRGFMEHPRDRALTLIPPHDRAYRELAFYDRRIAPDGTAVVGRIALADEWARSGTMLNASATLLPRARPRRALLRSVLGRLGAACMPGHRSGSPDDPAWSCHPAPARAFDGWTVLLNLEQPPRRENAVLLSSRRDAHGIPLPELHWRWHREDHARLEQLRAIVGAALEGAGVGRIRVDASALDPNACHHAGTTRMDPDARHGVVDEHGRVHGSEALYVTGASVFPTSGFANPTLTIIAMALRLAERLREDA